MSLARIALLCLAALVVAGCGSTAGVVPVSGKVTVDGKPQADIHVSFQPFGSAGGEAAATGSYGVTDAEGKYTLKMQDSDRPGAIVGKHRVELNYKNEASDDRDPRLRPPPKVLPERYNRRSEQSFDVPAGGTTAANFDLQSK